MVGSRVSFRNRTLRSIAPLRSKRSRKVRVSRAVMPMPQKTTANGSPCGARAPSTIWAASSSAGQPGAGEDRELLAAHQRVHAVDGGDAGLDEVRRLEPPGRDSSGAPQIGPRAPRRPAAADRRAAHRRR